VIFLEQEISCSTGSYVMDQLYTIPTLSWSQPMLLEIPPVVSLRRFCSLRHSFRWYPSLPSSSSKAKLKERLFRKLKMNFRKNLCQPTKQTCKYGLFFNLLTSLACHLSSKFCTFLSWQSGGTHIFLSWKTTYWWCLKSAKHQWCTMKSANKLLLLVDPPMDQNSLRDLSKALLRNQWPKSKNQPLKMTWKFF